MADFNAIAAVSRTLRRLLLDRMTTPGVGVTLAPPDVTVAGVSGSRVNLYCYQLLEYAPLKNQAIVGHEHPAAFGHPPLSLSLRYLMTSYARSEDQPDSDLIAQAIMGDAMLTMHDFGGRWDDLLLITNRAGAIGDPLLDPVLRNEAERVKVVLAPVTADEVSKLWSAMPQANLRRAVVYDASIVQIESRVPRRQSQPVTSRHLLFTVARPPRIDSAWRTPPPLPAPQVLDQRIAVGEEITITHAPVVAERLYVRFAALEPIRVPLPSTGTLRLLIPDNQYPIDLDHTTVRPILPEHQLQPGVLEVVLLGATHAEGVRGGPDRGTPFATDRMLRSNTTLMQLVPQVTGNTAAGNAAAILSITGQRLWTGASPTEVIVGDVAISVRVPQGADPWAAPTATKIEIPVSAVAAVLHPQATPYPLAVQVNGARNPEAGFTFRLDP